MFWKHPVAWLKDTTQTLVNRGFDIAESDKAVLLLLFLTFPLWLAILAVSTIVKFFIDLYVRKPINLEATTNNISAMNADQMQTMLQSLLEKNYFSEASKDFQSRLEKENKSLPGQLKCAEVSCKNPFIKSYFEEKLGVKHATLVDTSSIDATLKFELDTQRNSEFKQAYEVEVKSINSESLARRKELLSTFIANCGNIGKQLPQDIERLAASSFLGLS